MKCPGCGAPASGNFCSACGQPLGLKKCPSCGTEMLAGSRFCTGCGTALKAESNDPGVPSAGDFTRGTRQGAGQNLGWWVAGALLVVVLVALGYPILRPSEGPGGNGATLPGMGAPGAGTSAVDLTTMPIQEQATILFNRVMASSSSGDTADVAFFLPKALIIHEQLNPTDPDGLYHFALLHLVEEDYESALAKAEEGLAQIPDYLLLLAVAAEASIGLGEEEAAREWYAHFLEVYDAEMTVVRPGYEHHTQIFPAYRDQAELYLAGG